MGPAGCIGGWSVNKHENHPGSSKNSIQGNEV
jgi:hypothetical protein